MGEKSAEDYCITIYHLWIGKLLGDCHQMITVSICLCSQMLSEYSGPLVWSSCTLQLEIMFVLTVQISGCIVLPFAMTLRGSFFVCFSISRSNQVGWCWSFWHFISNLREKTCAFTLFSAPAGSVPFGPLQIASVGTRGKIGIKSSVRNPGKEESNICSSSGLENKQNI